MTDLITNRALLPPDALGAPTRAPQAGRSPSQSTDAAEQAAGPSFADTLAQASSPSFSKHALERLQRRGIELDSHALGRLSEGIQRAAGKGSRNSVVLVDGTAFVTSVQNNTVITAVTPEHMRSHVFTNIDSAVIA
jgi:flagellar operon protein